MIFIDTNIFLEVMLKQKKADDCKILLEFIEKSPKCAWTNIYHIFSMVLIVQNRLESADKSKIVIRTLGSYEGLQIYTPSLGTISRTLDIQSKFGLDFDDGLVITTMNELNVQKLVTFDKHFSDIEEIDVISPSKAKTYLKKFLSNK